MLLGDFLLPILERSVSYWDSSTGHNSIPSLGRFHVPIIVRVFVTPLTTLFIKLGQELVLGTGILLEFAGLMVVTQAFAI